MLVKELMETLAEHLGVTIGHDTKIVCHGIQSHGGQWFDATIEIEQEINKEIRIKIYPSLKDLP